MNVTYSDKAKQSGEDYLLLQQATKELEPILRQSGKQVTAEWDRGEDTAGRTVYTLRLSDRTGPVSDVFTRDELRSPSRTSFRLHLLWDEVLRARIQRQLQELAGTGGAEN